MRSMAAWPTHGPSLTSGGDATTHPQIARASRQSIQYPPNPMTPNRTLPPATAAARIAPLLLALAGLAIAAGGLWLWRHRRQIGAALVTAATATYAAGAWCRQQIEALAADSARRLPSQPVAAVAPCCVRGWRTLPTPTTTWNCKSCCGSAVTPLQPLQLNQSSQAKRCWSPSGIAVPFRPAQSNPGSSRPWFA
jgi:hypothetical protein